MEVTNDPQDPNEIFNKYDKMNRTGVAAVSKDKGTLNHIHLINLYIHDVNGNVQDKHMLNGGIYMSGFKPTDEKATGPAKFDDVLIEGCTVENVRRWGISVGYTVHYKDIPYGNLPDEIMKKYGSTNIVIRNNFVNSVGGDAITTHYSYRPIVEYNVAKGVAKDMNPKIYNQYFPTGFGGVAAGIWPWMCKDAIFQHNEVYDTVTNPDSQAYDADYGDGTIYQYNYSHNNGGGVVMLCGTYAINTIFRYNISQDDLDGLICIPGNPNGHFYNNTFYLKEGVTFIRKSMNNGYGLFENNIIYNSGKEITEDWEPTNKVTYNNNIYYGYTNTPKTDLNAITEDPMFLDPGSAPTSKDSFGDTFSKDHFNG